MTMKECLTYSLLRSQASIFYMYAWPGVAYHPCKYAYTRNRDGSIYFIDRVYITENARQQLLHIYKHMPVENLKLKE